MSNIRCEFCNKDFSSNGNLTTHKKTAKYCLKKRGVFSNSETNVECKYCLKPFTSTQSSKSHEEKCSYKSIANIENLYKLKLQEKDQEIKFLKQQVERQHTEIEAFKQQVASIALEGVRKHTTTTTNNIMSILTPLDLSEEKINSIVENSLDSTYFLDAQKGVAKFCTDNLIKTEEGKQRLVCSDPVRERYKYIDEKGNLIEDIQARQFLQKVLNPIIENSKKVHKDLKDKYNQMKEEIKTGLKQELSDYMIELKEKYAEQCMSDIKDIPYETRNKKFRKELAIRTRPPRPNGV